MKNLIISKRAQVTAFLIVAIILLFSSAVIFYIRDKVGQIEPSLEPIIRDVPLEVKPIHQYVEECVDRISVEALVKLGQHGGYINITDFELSSREFEIDLMNPTSSDAVQLVQFAEETTVPYWIFQKTDMDCTDCVIGSNTPTIAEIEKQIAKYIKFTLRDCLDGFESFKEQAFVIEERGDISPQVRVNEEDVAILVEYPLLVKKAGKETLIDQFFVKQPLKLKKMYTLALELMTHEADTQFLEGMLTRLISYHSGLNSNLLPPLAEITHGHEIVIWSKYAVKQMLQELISSYVPIIQVEGTKGFSPIILPYENRYEESLYNYLARSPELSDDYSFLETNFLYLYSPIYLEITPNEGDILKPHVQEVKPRIKLLPTIRSNHYDFFYDVSYPVVIEIKDDNALAGEGYSFLFSMEANIRDNRNLLEWHRGEGTFGRPGGTADFDVSDEIKDMLDDINQRIENELQSGEHPDDITEELRERFSESGGAYGISGLSDLRRRASTPTLFCGHNQRLSGNITIKTYDRLTDLPIEGVSVTFGCGDYASCPVGATVLSYITDEAELVTQLPLCIGGYMTLKKDGYEQETKFITTKIGENAVIIAQLQPLFEFNVSVKKHVLFWNWDDNSWPPRRYIDLLDTPLNLQDSDSVIISIEKKATNPWDYVQAQTLMFDKSLDLTPEQEALLHQIKLTPGTYDITAIYLDNNGFIIPKKCKRICVKYWSWGSCRKHERIPSTDINITPAPLGGLILTEETRQWSVTNNELSSAQGRLEIHIITVPVPTCLGDLDELEKTDHYTMLYYNQYLKPKFI